MVARYLQRVRLAPRRSRRLRQLRHLHAQLRLHLTAMKQLQIVRLGFGTS
jgi:hypothetical protein